MSEPTSPTAPVAQYPPYPDRERSRAPEYYGFVAWTGTAIAFVLYILWALLPDSWIQAAGVLWYPSRSV
jgi:phosphatidylinositol glycan class P protein